MHMASGMPGALQMLLVVFSNFSAFYHVDSKISSEMIVIPHLSGGKERSLIIEFAPDVCCASNSNAKNGISITLYKCFFFAHMTS